MCGPRLRLQEVRRLMLATMMRAVPDDGSGNPSQFSREYKGFFGKSPVKDIDRLPEVATNALTLTVERWMFSGSEQRGFSDAAKGHAQDGAAEHAEPKFEPLSLSWS